jgi:hypothetical protein
MGYRSDVGYVIQFHEPKYRDDTPKDKQVTKEGLFNVFLADAKSKEDTKNCFEESDWDLLTINQDECFIKFSAYDVKWYEDYDDVKCHEALIVLAQEYSDMYDNTEDLISIPISYAKIRIGEQMDDIAEDYGGDDGYSLMSISRNFEFNV